MTPDEIRIAVAEECGWTLIERRPSIFADVNLEGGWLSGMNPKPCKIEGIVQEGEFATRPANESDYGWEGLPAYTTSLDACAEFERGLKDGEFYDYCALLHKNTAGPTCNDYDRAGVTATPLQRCEAFLRVRSRWREEPPTKEDFIPGGRVGN